MAKMYFELNNAGNGILIDAGGTWLYFDVAEIPVDLSEYVGGENNIDATVGRIRAAINSGDLYNAEEFAAEYVNDATHTIADYSGYTLDDIDNCVNYETNSFGDRVPINHDTTAWIEI